MRHLSIVVCSFTLRRTVVKKHSDKSEYRKNQIINEVTHLNRVLKSLKLSKQNIIDHHYKIKREKVGFVNAKDGK